MTTTYSMSKAKWGKIKVKNNRDFVPFLAINTAAETDF